MVLLELARGDVGGIWHHRHCVAAIGGAGARQSRCALALGETYGDKLGMISKGRLPIVISSVFRLRPARGEVSARIRAWEKLRESRNRLVERNWHSTSSEN